MLCPIAHNELNRTSELITQTLRTVLPFVVVLTENVPTMTSGEPALYQSAVKFPSYALKMTLPWKRECWSLRSKAGKLGSLKLEAYPYIQPVIFSVDPVFLTI